MKSKKKVISIILSLLIVLSIVSTNIIFVLAGTVKESEANNTADNANAVSLGSSIIGSVSSSSDVDYYEFTVSKNGYIEIEFSNPVLTDNNAKWAVVVYKFAESLHEIHYHSISATKAKTELPKIGVTPGTYYIKVSGEGDWASDRAHVNNVEYSIKTDFTATDYWESEINGDFSTADKINLGNTYSGYLKDSDDTDYYEFTVSKNGNIKIEFTNPVLTDNNAKWAITVYKYSDSYEEIHRHTISATKAKTELPKIGVTPGTYYIKVSGEGDWASDRAHVNNVKYSIKTDFTATDYWESEINGDFSTADKINLGNTYSGYLKDSDDTDYYEFTVAKNGNIKIEFTNPVLTDNNAKWAITVYKYSDSYEEIHRHTVSATKAKTELPKIGMTPGTYYIKVSGEGDWASDRAHVNNVEYSIKTDFTATDYWESETNGDFPTADMIYGGKSYSGYIKNSDDTDCYEFTVSKNGNIEIEFTNPILTDNNAKWAITVYKYSDSYEEIFTDVAKATSAKTTFSDIGVTPGTYYIKVSGEGDWASDRAHVNNVEYSVIVSGDCVEQSTATSPADPDVTLGDVNNDGFVDAGDAVLISRYDAGFITLSDEQLEAGDVNDDGTVDAGDAVVISRFDAGFISSIR